MRRLRVVTPIPAVHLDLLRRAAQTSGAMHGSCHVQWLPQTPGCGLRFLVEAFQAAGAAGISCNRVCDAVTATRAGAKSVVIVLPPVVGDGPRILATLAGQTEVTVLIDHFAQAECLARACAEQGTLVRLLLRVDVGRERLGVRPGPDLHDLACGVATLEGSRLAGLAVVATTVETSGVSRLTHGELSRLLIRCQRSLARSGVAAAMISVSHQSDLDALACVEPSTLQARTPLNTKSGNPFSLIAGVIGRPTRHQAVIDAGRRDISLGSRLLWPADGSARLLAVEESFSVVQLSGTGHNLAIGDTVVFTMDDARLAHQGSVLVEEAWHWRVEVPVGGPGSH